MAFGLDIGPVMAGVTASAEATDRLATAIDRLAAATERGNELAIEWGSPNWGKPGHNVHVASDGSFVPDSHTEAVSDQ